MPSSRVALAVDFYVAYPEEVEQRIAADEQAASRLRELIERRRRLISG